ncbi:hypothetical protein [Planctomicrobium piriforme]|uniref:Carboxypeptidase regulatory-like domain-containing protein n=1 Tax=Planctomicrobium piriforme TaxID=1576369 RepID=A0A1I3C671_9PLAN|nr:hypothetical protein [Planctomicrobium piriforme]SFH69501.1 hypothetical protein SAMN05421753_102104 [Planctomicrobium piriforme]
MFIPVRGVLGMSLLGLAVTWGCGSKESIPRSAVSGQVTFEGQPLEAGVILFVPGTGVKGAPVHLSIQAGKYDSASDPADRRGVVTGNNQIQILAMKKTGKKIKNPDNRMEEEVLQYIPARYNIQTELSQVIQPGKQELNFDLKK